MHCGSDREACTAVAIYQAGPPSDGHRPVLACYPTASMPCRAAIRVWHHLAAVALAPFNTLVSTLFFFEHDAMGYAKLEFLPWFSRKSSMYFCIRLLILKVRDEAGIHTGHAYPATASRGGDALVQRRAA